MKPAQGQAHLKDLLAAAKDAGLETLVLDHPTEEPYHSRRFAEFSMAVAPEQEAMAAVGLKAQPKVPGNGCCMCCGGAPPDIDVGKITALGGKYAQADDGRIIEYYTYGSEDSDAQTLLQINGSCGSARLFSQMTGMVKVMKDLKIRGISISLPGHGFSSNHPSRQIGNWPREDVRPVFEKEQIHSTFMVEGMSFGSSHAMAVMHEFPDRVTRAHLLVPYLPVEIRRQEGWKLYGQDDSFRCQYPWVSSCWPRACCLFCCCSMCFDLCGAANMAVSDVKKHDEGIGYALKCKDWKSYIEALQQQVETPELRSRPLILFAHSHGCLQAYGLARQLGKRVLKFFLAARRPPTMPLLDEVWGVSKGSDIQSMDETALLEGLVGAWRNRMLESVRGSSLPPVAKKILSTVREQYASPCTPGGSSELDVVVSGDAAVAAPIVAFACSQEKEKGETATKMEGWRSLTSSSFELKVVEADHMDCLSSADGKNSELVNLLTEDIKKLLSDASAGA
eukprot:s691_g31.t1